MDICFLCGEPKGIVIDRRLKDSLQREAVYNFEPCDTCKEWMKKGIILISVSNDSYEKHHDNPYRTGGWIVLKEDAFLGLPITQLVKNEILEKRFAFIPDEAWDYFGLPREEIRNEENKI